MHPVEVEQVLETIVCLYDSREKPTPRLAARLKQTGLPTERVALSVGDYGAKVKLPNDEWYHIPAVIERKMNLDEAVMCFCQERNRFKREFQRAKESGIKIYLLVEDTTWAKIYAGKYRSQMRPKSLVASFLSWVSRYGCEIIFCESSVTGWLIKDILWYEAREILLNLGEEDGQL